MTGDIVITITVKPLKGGKRPIIVSAAPQGEMPLILTGHFQDHEALFQAAWIELLTRKSKVVKQVADGKKVAEKDEPEETAEEMAAGANAADPEGNYTAEEFKDVPEAKPDQLVREDLPIIEGDTAAE